MRHIHRVFRAIAQVQKDSYYSSQFYLCFVHGNIEYPVIPMLDDMVHQKNGRLIHCIWK